MKHLILVFTLAVGIVFNGFANGKKSATPHYSPEKFEQAVTLIKKYETLNSASHWPYVGYGHKVQPGEKYRKGVALTASQAESLLRSDLKKSISAFKEFGEASLLLGVLAYNIGPGKVKKSKLLDILNSPTVCKESLKKTFLSYSNYRGKPHKQLHKRRTEEFQLLYD